MPPLLKRILVHGTLTAAVLAMVGFGYAELAGLFLMAKAPTRATIESPAPVAADPLADEIQSRVPVMMAIWGFAFVTIGELVMHRIRSRRKPVAPPEPQPDPTELLLKQIMLDAEAAKSAPTPSPAPAENSPVAS